ncbi:MAG: hypothetical protein DSY90_08015 [Deltaproteobacteria bacterium]|nr:MAG: hypothetical protein DSY90_08015 [Deltaproteobacteria bacterium]
MRGNRADPGASPAIERNTSLTIRRHACYLAFQWPISVAGQMDPVNGNKILLTFDLGANI